MANEKNSYLKKIAVAIISAIVFFAITMPFR